MELRHLEQIVAIARCGGFSGAARHLNIAQSTLSKSIARLESQLAVTLFHRDGGGAHPTAYGEFLVERGEAILGTVDDLNRDFDKLLHGRRGRLRIGAGPAPSRSLLPLVIAEMAARFPHLSISAAHDQARRLPSDLVRGLYDAVFTYPGAAAEFEDLVRIQVMQSLYTALVRPGHPALRGHALSSAELLEFKIAGCPPNQAFLDWIGPVRGVPADNLRGFRSDSYDLIRDRALLDDYVAVVPLFVFAEDIQRGSLVRAPLQWPGVYECWMLMTRERAQAPEMRVLAEVARKAGRSAGTLPKELDDESVSGPLSGAAGVGGLLLQPVA